MNGYFNYPPYYVMNSIPVARSVSPLTRLGNLFRGGGALGSSAGSAIGTAASAGRTGITFSGILNGASKTLGVINQAIPVFYQVKPIWNNAKTMFRVMKEVNSDSKSSYRTDNSEKPLDKDVTITHVQNSSSSNGVGPTFFA